MVIRKALVALATAGMLVGSTAAVAAPAPIADVRAGSPVGEAESALGLWHGIVILMIIIGFAGILWASSDEDLPISA